MEIMGNSMFSAAVRVEIRFDVWNICPTVFLVPQQG